MSRSDCCSGVAAPCAVPRPGSCARCGGELAAWAMARGTMVFCSWFCWHLASPLDEAPPDRGADVSEVVTWVP